MIQGIKDYVKCLYENKYTFVGVLGMSGSGILLAVGGLSSYSTYTLMAFMIGGGSFGLICVTDAGAKTFLSYNRAKGHIDKHNTLDEKFLNKFSTKYCDQVGLKLACRESGLEHLLETKK